MCIIDTVNFDIYETRKLPLSSSTDNPPTFETTSESSVEQWSQHILTHSSTVSGEQSLRTSQGQGIIYVANVIGIIKHNSA